MNDSLESLLWNYGGGIKGVELFTPIVTKFRMSRHLFDSLIILGTLPRTVRPFRCLHK